MIKKLIFNLIIFFQASLVFAAFPGDYTKYQLITVNASKVDANVTDFPVYIDLNDCNVTGDDLFDTVRSDGGDIRITLGDGTTQLPREVVSINATTKTGELHFSGNFSSVSDTPVRIWYNGTDSEPAANATYGAENVWTNNFEAVWHLENLTDSTNNSYDLSSFGATSSSGDLGGAYEFQASNSDYLQRNEAPITDYPFTFSAWTNSVTVDPGGPQQIINVTDKDTTNHQVNISLRGDFAGDPLMIFVHNYGGSTADFATTSNGYTANTWYYTTGTFTSTLIEAVLNADFGNAASTDPTANTLSQHDRVRLGAAGDSTPGGYMDGKIDEARIASVVRSQSWISTEYNNQNSPATFYSVSTEQTIAVPTANETNTFFWFPF